MTLSFRHLCFGLALCCSMVVGAGLPGEFSGELAMEARGFPQQGAFGNTDRADFSITLQPEYVVAWEEDRKVVAFEPFVRWSSLDDDRSHADIRELSFVGSWEYLELRLGISKVFWGVTESQHLVDVINQTDLVENPDGEDKLGQPMVNAVYVSDFGNFEFFLLPYFRERTFAGTEGRLRGNPVISNDAIYLSGEGEKHIDGAFRWSHYLGALEWGIAYFNGTDREPGFRPGPGGSTLQPVYGQAEQWGLELQYVIGDWLLKGEALAKESTVHGDYWASVTGFEYTFTNIYQGMDIGVLYEWLYDERGVAAGSGLDNASFGGTRIALNDENSTELLLGGFVDHHAGELSNAFLESSRRINENWKATLEAGFFVNPQPGSFLAQLKRDDYLQFRLSYYW